MLFAIALRTSRKTSHCPVRQRNLCFLLLGIVFSLSLLSGVISRFPFSNFLLGDFVTLVHFLSFFLSGACFYLFRDHIRYKASHIFVAAAVLFVCMFKMKTAQLGLATLGAYVLFGFAFSQFSILERLRTLPDVSYGIYLYGWPTQKLFLWYFPALSPWLLFLLTCALCYIFGLLSWHLVERPFLRLKNKSLK